MRREYAAGCAIGLFMLLAGCSDTPAPVDTSVADQKTIKDGEVAWAGQYGSKDVDKIVGHYTDDASVMAPNMPEMKGKDAIRTGLTGMLSDPNIAMNFTNTSVDVAKAGDYAFSQGTYSMTMTNPKTKQPETEAGKYLTVYKKQSDGSWKAVKDINNADAPAASAVVARVKKTAPAIRKRKKK